MRLDEVDGKVACTGLRCWGVVVARGLPCSLEIGAHHSQSVAVHGANARGRFAVEEAVAEFPKAAELAGD